MAADSSDPALQALLLPLASGTLAWPAQPRALFLHARAGWPLRQTATPGLVVQQDYKPDADALQADGHALASDDDGGYPLVLLLPPRQREAMRALFAQAFDRCADGGVVVASIANDAGAKSGEADFKKLAGLDGTQSKHHCRVFWARKDAARMDRALLEAWRTLDAPRFVEDAALPQGRFLTRPGVFAWNRVDPASRLLAAQLPQDLAGQGADLGAGWGYLSIEILRRNAGVRALDLYEADARALALARDNLAPFSAQATLGFHWHDATAGLPQDYDFIVTNPPFHAHDRADRPELGQRFIEVAAQALRPGGRLYLVANRHLPYEAALSAQFGGIRVLAQQSGFKVVEAVKAGERKPARRSR